MSMSVSMSMRLAMSMWFVHGYGFSALRLVPHVLLLASAAPTHPPPSVTKGTMRARCAAAPDAYAPSAGAPHESGADAHRVQQRHGTRNLPPLTTHGLPRTCDTTHSTVRQAAPERARGVPPKRARRRQRGSALGRTPTHTSGPRRTGPRRQASEAGTRHWRASPIPPHFQTHGPSIRPRSAGAARLRTLVPRSQQQTRWISAS